MVFNTLDIPGLILIEPKIWKDDRGYFFESYSRKLFDENGIDADFVQDNQSLSQRGTLRGLHAQSPPFAQGKLVRVIQGKVMDVAVDVRKDSPTYGKHFSVELSGDNQLMFWVPPGFLHGFSTLEDNTIFAYKVSALYSKDSETGVRWDDPDLGIDWGLPANEILLSDKDQKLSAFQGFNSPF
jgi:dTDP-4-dehydrorhamnose 3,5-epimerase